MKSEGNRGRRILVFIVTFSMIATMIPMMGAGRGNAYASEGITEAAVKETITAMPEGGDYTAFRGDLKISVGESLNSETRINLTKTMVSEDGVYSPEYGITFSVQPPDTVEVTFMLSDSAKNVKEVMNLGMWVQANGSSQWTFAGGAYDSKNNTLTLLTRVNGIYRAEYREYSFPDVSAKHWAKKYIEILAARNIMLGDNRGNANPNGAITRAETAAMIVRVLQSNSLIGRTPSVSDNYSDVKEGSWFYYPMNLAAKRGIISGYGDGTARPNNHVTREELAAIFAKAMLKADAIESAKEPDFNDSQTIEKWARAYVAILQEIKFLSGDDKGNFNPKANATRAEVAKLMYMMMEKYGLLIYDEQAEEIPCLTCPYSR